MVLTYLKIAAALLLLCVAYYLGGLSGKAKLAALQEAQSKSVATAVLAEQTRAKIESDRLNEVLASYEKAPIDPIAIDIGSRVYHYIEVERSTLPEAGVHPGGTLGPSGVPAAPDPVEPALNAVLEACSRDATRLNALIAAWPHKEP